MPLFVASALKDMMLGLHLKLVSGTKRRGGALLEVEQVIKWKDAIREFAKRG